MLNFGYIVLVIGRYGLKTVSSHNLKTNTWLVDLPQINKTRYFASACFLAGNAYVFTGYDADFRTHLNSIEKISKDSLFSRSQKFWTLIEVPHNVLTIRILTAVAPLNDTEIVIMGGYHVSYF